MATLEPPEKRYNVLAYGSDPGRVGGGQVDLGGFDGRRDAQDTAVQAVQLEGYGSAQVIRNSDLRVVYVWDRQDVA